MNPVKNGQFWHSGGQNWRCLSKATNSGSPWPESALLSSVPFFLKEFVWIDRFYEKKRKLYFPKSMHFLLKKIGWVKKTNFYKVGSIKKFLHKLFSHKICTEMQDKKWSWFSLFLSVQTYIRIKKYFFLLLIFSFCKFFSFSFSLS